MGKVQSTFANAFPGAISREADDIVISMPNEGDAAIAFGAAVSLDAGNNGARAFASGDSMSNFLGFATRIGVKTADTYGGNVASYAPGDIMSIIVRGSVCVPYSGGTIVRGGNVYITSDGTITATPGGNTQLTNCQFRGVVGSGVAEIVITKRNIQ